MRNLEELVVFTLRSIPQADGADLFSGVADMDGFHHQSMTAYPEMTYDRGRFGDTIGLDFAEASPNTIVRVGSFPGLGGRLDGQNCSAYSANYGETWREFSGVPEGAFNRKLAKTSGCSS